MLCDKEVIRIVNIKKVEIIRTAQTSEIELSTIQKRSRSEIDEFNSQSESVFLIGLGRGQDPEDIVEAGEDVTSKYIVGPPGHAVRHH